MACSCSGNAQPQQFNYYGGEYDFLGPTLSFPSPFGYGGSGVFSADFAPGPYEGNRFPANPVGDFFAWLAKVFSGEGKLVGQDGSIYPAARATTDTFV